MKLIIILLLLTGCVSMPSKFLATPPTCTSPSGATLPSAGWLCDGTNTWTLANGVVSENGQLAGFTSQVTLLLYYNNVIYQQNQGGGWWKWSGSWVASSDPRVPIGIKAARAFDFRNSFGMDNHFAWGMGTAQQNAQQLQFLGMNHLRDNGITPDNLANFEALCSLGIFVNTIPAGGNQDVKGAFPGQLTTMVQLNKDRPGCLLSIEGPNELNGGSGIAFNGQAAPTSGNIEAQIMQFMYPLVKASMPTVAVLNASLFTNGDWQTYLNQEGNVSAFADYGNFHVYTGGPPPASAILQGVKAAQQPTPGKPIQITEFGYTQSWVSDQVSAKYNLDAMMDAFHAGVSRLYFYTMDETGEGFGFYDANNNPRPVATAFHNLSLLTQDSGTTAASFAPGQLNYNVGNANLNSILLQKSNGVFELIVWAEGSTAIATTVSLGASYPTVNVYDPTVGPTAKVNANVSGVAVTVMDHPIVIEVVSSK